MSLRAPQHQSLFHIFESSFSNPLFFWWSIVAAEKLYSYHGIHKSEKRINVIATYYDEVGSIIFAR